MKKFVIALVGAVALATAGVVSATTSSVQYFQSGLYANQPVTCAGGSQVDPSGQSFGIFGLVDTHGSQVVRASVQVDNLRPNLTYSVYVTQYGRNCIAPVLKPIYETAEFTTNAVGQGYVHFEFWAHSGETSAFVTLQHGLISAWRVVSPALPINR
jgi:hypothetical protein